MPAEEFLSISLCTGLLYCDPSPRHSTICNRASPIVQTHHYIPRCIAVSLGICLKISKDKLSYMQGHDENITEKINFSVNNLEHSFNDLYHLLNV
jgi:hypothetical protein